MESEIVEICTNTKKVSLLSKISIVLTISSGALFFTSHLLGIESLGLVLVISSFIAAFLGFVIAFVDVLKKNRRKVFSIIVIVLNGLWVGFFGLLLFLIRMYSNGI